MITAKTLALYLGCDYYVFPDETITSGWLKVQLEHHPNLRYKYPLTLSNIQKVQEDGYKLLLRPLSSMTEEECKELFKIFWGDTKDYTGELQIKWNKESDYLIIEYSKHLCA